ncbi:MAG: hypothetical protein IJH63_00500 [Methanobrevibacter sp.]|nr:hypothetical protein [Methanosphaera sp.]MBR0369183.1 hypothetical protein [Methanobrevibacter sp.]
MSGFVFVSDLVKLRLKSLSITNGESYDSILSRLLDCKVESYVCEYRVFDTVNDCFVDLRVDWGSLTENLCFGFDGVYSDSFPVNPCVDYNVWCGFKEVVCGLSFIFNVLVVLDRGGSVVVDGLVFNRFK